jgi:hypothetical protein
MPQPWPYVHLWDTMPGYSSAFAHSKRVDAGRSMVWQIAEQPSPDSDVEEGAKSSYPAPRLCCTLCSNPALFIPFKRIPEGDAKNERGARRADGCMAEVRPAQPYMRAGHCKDE